MKYYMIGIKGSGMSALALILNDLGYKVVGYDDEKKHQFTEDKLIERNIPIYSEPNDEMDKETIVIRSTAIKENIHPEMIKANEMGLKVYEYFEMVGRLSKMFKTITVAGCHGKTTTTSMIAHTLGPILGCNYLIGDGLGYASKENEWFALEACEYYRHFLNYEPEYAIITNIELDHVDYYKDIDDVIDAYQSYANKANKMVIACGDDPYTHSLEVNVPIFFYGISEDNDIVAKNVNYTDDGMEFDVFVEGNYYGYFSLPFYGKHMLLNSLAVISVCYYERIEAKEVSKYLKTFKGAKRRFAEKHYGDIVTIDDYAHHPTEVKVTLKAARQKYPDKELVAVFEPHTFSRTNKFYAELAESLNIADKVYVLDIFPAREKQEDFEGVTSNLIIDNLKNGEHITQDDYKKLLGHKNAAVVFMSPKEIYDLQHQYEEKLEEGNK